MKIASKYVRRYCLNSDPVIDALGNKDWKNVDPHGGYKKKKIRLFSKLLASYERSSGADLSTFRKMMGGTYRNADCRSDAVATTEWVQRHEDTYFVTKWSAIYDANSEDPVKNCGNPRGIRGGRRVLIDFVKNVVPGKKYKVILSLWDVEIAVIEGMVLYPQRTIWGTCIYDGVCSYSISVDIRPVDGTLQVFACNTKNNVDYSKECRLMLLYESM